MLRPAKITTHPLEIHWLRATQLSSGAKTDPYLTSNQAFNSLEEYMDSDVDHGVYELHNVKHLKTTRELLLPTVRGEDTWNPSDHSNRWTCDYDPPSAQFVWNSNALLTGSPPSASGYYGAMFDPINGLKPLGTYDTVNGIVIPLPDDIDNLVSKAITAMLPGLRPVENISLINSIIELKDFASLPRTLKNVGSLASSALSYLRKRPGYKTMTLRNLLRKGADVYLQAEFNILPLLSDISAVSTAIRTVRNRLRQLVSHANSPQKRYNTVNLLHTYRNENSVNSIPLPTNCVPRNIVCGRNVTYRVAQFNAQMMYRYSLPSWVTEDSLMAALLDMLGVNLNPRILWNAIPWSFVVDWLANVNSWLDNWRTRNIEPIVDIRGFSWSVKVERWVTTTLGFDYGDACVRRFDSSYIRKVGDRSALYSSLVTSGLSPKEFSLAAALAFSR